MDDEGVNILIGINVCELKTIRTEYVEFYIYGIGFEWKGGGDWNEKIGEKRWNWKRGKVGKV